MGTAIPAAMAIATMIKAIRRPRPARDQMMIRTPPSSSSRWANFSLGAPMNM